MHIIKPIVHRMRPAQEAGKMQGRVMFTAVAQFDCTCDIPRGKTSSARIATLKAALIQDAMRQARGAASGAIPSAPQLYVA